MPLEQVEPDQLWPRICSRLAREPERAKYREVAWCVMLRSGMRVCLPAWLCGVTQWCAWVPDCAHHQDDRAWMDRVLERYGGFEWDVVSKLGDGMRCATILCVFVTWFH